MAPVGSLFSEFAFTGIVSTPLRPEQPLREASAFESNRHGGQVGRFGGPLFIFFPQAGGFHERQPSICTRGIQRVRERMNGGP